MSDGGADRPGATPHTRFAVNVEMWWSDQPPLERLRRAAALGFPAVELWHWPRWDVEAVAATCADLGLEVAQFGAWDFEPSLADPANHARFEEAVGQAAEVARTLGAPLANVNGPYRRPGIPDGEAREQVAAALRRVVPVLEAGGLTLLVEPMNTRVDHPGYTLPNSDHVLEVCRAVGSDRVRVNWDLYHLHISEGDLSGHLREGWDHLGYVQVADHPGRHEPGTGEIHYPFLLGLLRDLGYRGYVGLECSPTGDPVVAARGVRAADVASARHPPHLMPG